MRNLIAINTPVYIHFFPVEDYSAIWDGYFNEIDYYEGYEGPEDQDIHTLQEQWYSENRERLEAEERQEEEDYQAALKEHNNMLHEYHLSQFSEEELEEMCSRD